MPTLSRVRRKRGPAIAWAPTHDAYYVLAGILRTATGAPQLYVTQAAILELQAHLRESASALPFGLLAGDLCLCPELKLEYLLVDTVARARVELTGDDPRAQLSEELTSLAAEQAKARKLAIGWYLGGMADDLSLDSDVATLHRDLFPEPWQLVLVLGESSGLERGAFLRFDGLSDRMYAIRFFEALSERAYRGNGERHTAIRWENYRTDEAVSPLSELEAIERRADASARARSVAGRFGASLESLRRGWRAPKREKAASAPERAEPAAVREQAAAPRATADAPPRLTAPLSRSVPALPPPVRAAAREVEPVPAPVTATPVAEPAAPSPAPPAQVEAPAAPAASAAPASDVQQVFIDGSLVLVPLTYEFTENPGMLASAGRHRMTALLVGALVLILLLVLYLLAR